MSIREKLEGFDRKEKEKAWKILTNGELHNSDAQTLIYMEILSKKIDLLAEELENLVRGGEGIKMEEKEEKVIMDELLKRKLELAYELKIDAIPLDSSLEQVMCSEAYLDIYHDGKAEALFRLKEEGEEIKAVNFPYETATLKSGVNYTISQGCFVIYGIKIIKGNAEIKIRGMGDGKPFMVFQGSNVLLARAYILLSSSPIWILGDKSETEYRFVGLGLNSPKMVEMGLFEEGAEKEKEIKGAK